MSSSSNTVPPTRESRINAWGIRIVGLVVSISIAVYLLLQIDRQQFMTMVGDLSFTVLLGAFGIYMILNFFRAMRFSVLLGGEGISAVRLYPIALFHNFLVRILPFKTGELSYIVMTRHYLHRSLVEGVGSLVSARLFDLLVVISGFTVGMLTLVTSSTDHTLALLFIPLLALCALILYFAAPLIRKLSTLERYVLKASNRQNSRLVLWLDRKLIMLAEHLERIHTPRLFVILIALSVCNYLCSASFNLLLMNGLGIRAPFGTLVVIVSIAMFAEALPFSVAGLGLVEGGWTLGLVTFAGLSTSEAVSVAFFLHACQLIAVALSGVIGYVLLHSSFARAPVKQPRML